MKSTLGLLSHLKKNALIGGVVGLGGLYVANRSIVTVPPNYVGHTNLFGDISQTKIMSGLHVINPLSKLILIPLLTNKITSHIDVSSNEGLSLSIQIDLIYNLNYELTRDIYLDFRSEYEDIFMKPLIQAALRDIISGYEAKALYSDKTRDEIKHKLMSDLTGKFESKGFIISQVLLNRIELPQQLRTSIENKLKAEQDNEQVEFTISKQRKEMNFKLEQGEMDYKIKDIEARSTRNFQDIVSKGLTQDALKWKALEATLALARSPNSKVVVIGNTSTNGLPLIFSDGK
jgi:prohibitin 1